MIHDISFHSGLRKNGGSSPAFRGVKRLPPRARPPGMKMRDRNRIPRIPIRGPPRNSIVLY